MHVDLIGSQMLERERDWSFMLVVGWFAKVKVPESGIKC